MANEKIADPTICELIYSKLDNSLFLREAITERSKNFKLSKWLIRSDNEHYYL